MFADGFSQFLKLIGIHRGSGLPWIGNDGVDRQHGYTIFSWLAVNAGDERIQAFSETALSWHNNPIR